MNDTAITLRPAAASDQETIRQMVREEQLDPTALDWSHFLVAEHDGQVVGIGQIRPYPRCRELGSLVVRREFRKQGVGAMLIHALLAQETGVVYLECLNHRLPYYQKFGFVEIPWWRAPMPLKLKAAFGEVIGRLFGYQVRVMQRG